MDGMDRQLFGGDFCEGPGELVIASGLLVEALPDSAGRALAQIAFRAEIVNGGLGDLGHRTEGGQQCLPSGGTDAGDGIEFRLDDTFLPPGFLESEGEAVGLVPYSLQQAKGGG